MRILHLNPFYFPFAGGIERRIREVGQRHARRHDVHVLTAQLERTQADEDDHGIHVHRLASKFFLQRFYNPPLVSTDGLSEAIRAIDPDVIDFHSRWSPSYAKAYKRAKAGRTFTYHNTYGEGSGLLGALSHLNDRSTRPFIAQSDRIIAISRFLAEDLKAHHFPEDRIRLVPNGVDRDALQTIARPSERADPNLIVAVGRVVRLKGFDLLVRALPHIDADVRLLVCGEGPERAALQRLAKRLGVADRVELPGWVPEPEKLGILADCLAYVQPSRFEAFGLAVLEAMAMGAPVVASRVGGLPEVVGDAGILVAPNDPQALAQAINRLHRDRAARARLASHTRERTSAFSWDRVSADLLNVYAEAARRPKV
jgi:glycosyltransferase involved in cell wall biosynthesis